MEGSPNVLEWSCGVSDYLAQMLALLVNVTLMAISPAPEKQFRAPLTGLAGNSGCRRTDSSCRMWETILLFANHRHFLHDNQDW